MSSQATLDGSPFDMSGKAALITRGGRGIGMAIIVAGGKARLSAARWEICFGGENGAERRVAR